MKLRRFSPIIHKQKEIIVEPQTKNSDLSDFVKKAVDLGITYFLCEPNNIVKVKSAGGKTVSNSDDADITIISNLNSEYIASKNQEVALKINIKSNKDIQEALEAAKSGVSSLFVETNDWKIIPLENLVADIHRFNTRIFSKVDNSEEIQTMFSVLELGIDGVIFSASSIEEVQTALDQILAIDKVQLLPAKVVEIKNLGVGDRVCIDTASILNNGEGILVGSQSNTLFLIHNESAGSKFTSPRPFRVNAGSIHSYVLMPDGKTKYLSEIESGTEILAVDKEGTSKKVLVGRVKIERRPLSLIKVNHSGVHGTALLQNAETIPLIGKKGEQIPVTQLKVGDEILVRVEKSLGRHFGVAVDEFVIEK